MLIGAQVASVEKNHNSSVKTVGGGLLESQSDGKGRSRISKALRIEWLGQTAASLCWIASVFTYGISSVGDWLQLLAASAWFLANIAVLMSSETE